MGVVNGAWIAYSEYSWLAGRAGRSWSGPPRHDNTRRMPMSKQAAGLFCLTAVVAMVAAPAVVQGADRMVIGEYFTRWN